MADITTSTAVDNFMQSADQAEMKTNIGLGTVAVEDIVPVTKGGTGVQTLSAAAVAIVNGNPIAPSTIGVSTNGAASAPPATLTGTWYSGGSGTTTKPQLLVEPAGTTSTAWSTAGTGLGVNAASGFIGKLIDIQLGGASKLNLNYDASLTLTGTSSTVNVNWPGENNTSLQQGGLVTNASGSVLWSNSNTSLGARDAGISRDSAGFLGQRSGTTPQGFSIYGTYTSTTNYERLKMCYNSGTTSFQIGTEKGSGGGSARNLDLVRDGTVIATVDSGGLNGPNDVFGGATLAVSGYARLKGSILSFGGSAACNLLVEGAAQKKMVFGSDWVFGFSNITTGTETNMRSGLDSAFSKISAGVLGVGNGTAGDYSGFVQDLYRRKGTGTPEAAVTAPVGAVFHRTDGGAGTSFYVKESGAGNTGWVAK